MSKDVEKDGIVDGLANADSFSIEEEWAAPPIIPAGVYHAKVTKVTYDPEQVCVVFQFTLQDNGGLMDDGVTALDGNSIFNRVWLPKPIDSTELTKNGKSKRVVKIDMMKRFADQLHINMNTPQAINLALANQEWVGIEADIEVTFREYEGKMYNDIRKVL